MRRHLPLAVTVIVIAGRLLVAAPPAPPPSANCGDVAKKPEVAFAVLGDGFTASQQGLLDRASASLVCGGAMLREAAYKAHPEQLLAETVSVASPTASIARPGTTPGSALEIVYNGSRRDCFFTTSDRAQKKIANAAVKALHRQVLVIVNISDQDAGCTEGGITYVTRGASWQTIAHEMGHILGLHDEYADLDGPDPDPLDRTNCSRTTSAWWIGAGLPNAAAIKECDRYGGVYRGYQTCRMRELASDFCLVCKRLIDERLATVSATATPASQPGPAVQLALRLHPADSDVLAPRVEVVASGDVTGPAASAPLLSAGRHFGVLIVGGNVVSVTDLSSTFRSNDAVVRRAYGGTTPAMHLDRPASQAIVFATAPQFTKAALKAQPVEFRVIRLGGQPPQVITTQFLNSGFVTTVMATPNLQSQMQ